MWLKLFPSSHNNEYLFDKNVKLCGEEYYLPWAWNELDEFLEKKNNSLPENNIGIHWFNGADKSKLYAISLEDRLTNFNTKCYLDKIICKYIFNKKISIVMAYYNRKKQLLQTLNKFNESNYKNIEVIIVDDNSNSYQKVDSFINNVKYDFPIKIINISEKDKVWVNPCIPYNIGISHTSGDIVILQNPEVIMVDDCLTYVIENLNYGDWLSLNCYGSPNFEFNNTINNKSPSEIFDIINNLEHRIGGNSVVRDDVGGWLNHYEKHFVAYHYFAAIHKKDLMEKMDGGFDPNFQHSIGGDDDEFIKRLIFNKFKFKINKFEKNQPFVIHLYHSKPEQLYKYDYRINKTLFDKKCLTMNFSPENNINLAPFNETPAGNRVLI